MPPRPFLEALATLYPAERLLMLEQFIRIYPTHPLAVLAASEVQALRVEIERAANRAKVIVYTTRFCGFCHAAKRLRFGVSSLA